MSIDDTVIGVGLVAGSVAVVIGTIFGYDKIVSGLRKRGLNQQYGPIVEQAHYNLNTPDLDARISLKQMKGGFPMRSGWNESHQLAFLLEPFDAVNVDGQSASNDNTFEQKSHSADGISGTQAYRLIMDAFRNSPGFRHKEIYVSHRKKGDDSTLFLSVTAKYYPRKGTYLHYGFTISGCESATIPFSLGELPESNPIKFEFDPFP